jgi:hypothetical protein
MSDFSPSTGEVLLLEKLLSSLKVIGKLRRDDDYEPLYFSRMSRGTAALIERGDPCTRK